ncbi:MAG: hypothetical protein FJX45_01015 [Alphaproteobacteria bacterium]|nr:hypothetical protein [Alphaproteobacteria bacterium]MBM3651285.1 hypothetical protein [Alphaproteobacteria bacterium]
MTTTIAILAFMGFSPNHRSADFLDGAKAASGREKLGERRFAHPAASAKKDFSPGMGYPHQKIAATMT